MIGQETIVYFFGAEIEKIGPKKYKITNGGSPRACSRRRDGICTPARSC